MKRAPPPTHTTAASEEHVTANDDSEKFTGLLLSESLEDQSVLSLLTIAREDIWDVGDRAADFQPRMWTAIVFEGDALQVKDVASKLSQALAPRWYANISTDETEYVVFRDRVFKHGKGDRIGAAPAVEYGRSVGIPEHQLDWIGD